jgi:ubiquinone/menaquinone biosynthesis C-methylase UbiE
MNRSDRARQGLLENLSEPKKSVILDVGCGFGETLVSLSEHGFTNLTGIDGDPKAVAHTQQILQKTEIHVVSGNVEHMPFSNASFDAALNLDVLEHVDDDQKTVKEIARILVDGGLFIGSTPYAGLSRIVDPENILACLRWKKPTHHHYTLRELHALLKQDFPLVQYERRGVGLSQFFFLTTYILRPFFRDYLIRTQRHVSQWEYAREFGWLSYHVIFFAKKHVKKQNLS